MSSDITEVVLLVCAGQHSVAGGVRFIPLGGSSAASTHRRQQAAHRKLPRSLPYTLHYNVYNIYITMYTYTLQSM